MRNLSTSESCFGGRAPLKAQAPFIYVRRTVAGTHGGGVWATACRSWRPLFASTPPRHPALEATWSHPFLVGVRRRGRRVARRGGTTPFESPRTAVPRRNLPVGITTPWGAGGNRDRPPRAEDLARWPLFLLGRAPPSCMSVWHPRIRRNRGRARGKGGGGNSFEDPAGRRPRVDCGAKEWPNEIWEP